jgi:hypothetical protein
VRCCGRSREADGRYHLLKYPTIAKKDGVWGFSDLR